MLKHSDLEQSEREFNFQFQQLFSNEKDKFNRMNRVSTSGSSTFEGIQDIRSLVKTGLRQDYKAKFLQSSIQKLKNTTVSSSVNMKYNKFSQLEKKLNFENEISLEGKNEDQVVKKHKIDAKTSSGVDENSQIKPECS